MISSEGHAVGVSVVVLSEMKLTEVTGMLGSSGGGWTVMRFLQNKGQRAENAGKKTRGDREIRGIEQVRKVCRSSSTVESGPETIAHERQEGSRCTAD
jgi:hypothetical protein